MTNLDLEVTKLIKQSLSIRSPQTGAHLMQQLKASLLSHGVEDFNIRTLGFKKFSDYLEKKHSDILTVNRPVGDGDITVSLKNRSDVVSMLKNVDNIKKISLKNSLWQAFSNSDINRKRYFRKSTGKIIHFVPGVNSDEEKVLNSDINDFIEISPITYEQQFSWLVDFVLTQNIESELNLINKSIEELRGVNVVSSSVSRALGPKFFTSWKMLRSEKITLEIEGWAKRLNIDNALIYESQININPQLPPFEAGHKIAENKSSEGQSPKKQAINLIEMLSDDDVSRVVLPILLSTMLIKSRL